MKRKLLNPSNQQPALLTGMSKEVFEAMANQARTSKTTIAGRIEELRAKRPGVAAGCSVARDYQGLNDLDDHIAGQERMAIAQNEILQFASEALSHFECIEVSRCTLANIEVLRQEGAARLVAAEKIDSAMKELISAILGYAATDPLRGFGQSRLKTAWNFHCHSARYRDFPRHVQGSIQAMTEPLGVAQARSCFADMVGNLGDDPAVVEQAARNALAGAQSDLSALLNQMNPVANDPAVDPSTALLAA